MSAEVMAARESGLAVSQAVEPKIRCLGRWERQSRGELTLWFNGWLRGGPDGATTPAALATLIGSPGMPSLERAEEIATALDGHFALVCSAPDWTLAVVDRVRSTPLLYASTDSGLLVGDDAAGIRRALEVDRTDLDPEAATVAAMSGFTLGAQTLYRPIRALQAGELVVARAGHEPETRRYYVYRPRPVDRAEPELRGALAELTLGVLQDMLESIGDRPILVPLSAGLDSRLIVSGLAHLGHRNVRCFAYGTRGNYEARASQQIARHLGYEWSFVEHAHRAQRRLFEGAEFARYLGFADTLDAVPFVQDFDAVRRLAETGFAPSEAVIVNGQTGDFISGNHIPAALADTGCETSPRDRILDAIVDKHYSLWNVLKTPERMATLRQSLWADICAAGGDADRDEAFALFELSEWQNRQSKYVVGGSRGYELHGFDWRIPLWDPRYMDFWAAAPLSAKRGQRLYRDMLTEANWGGVWRGVACRPRITPSWLRWTRAIARLAHAPLGRRRWRRFDRQYFAYWTDLVGNYAVVPYQLVHNDRRGHRNAISWIVETWLARHGLGIDGALGAGTG